MMITSGGGTPKAQVEMLRELSKSQKELSFPDSPPASLSNDKKTQFHEEQITVEMHQYGTIDTHI